MRSTQRVCCCRTEPADLRRAELQLYSTPMNFRVIHMIHAAQDKHHVTKPLKKHGIRIGQGNRVLVKPAARSGARNSGREYIRNVKIEYSDTRCAHKLQTGCASHVAKHGHDNHIQASLSSVHCAPTLAPVRRRGCCTECAESCWYWGTCKSLLPGTRGGVALTREPAADSS